MTTHIPQGRKDQNDQSLYQRYNVTKRHPDKDGPDDSNAIYFVLRIDHLGDDPDHIQSCQLAALEFARQTSNRKMGEQLRRVVAEQAGLLTARLIAQQIGEVAER